MVKDQIGHFLKPLNVLGITPNLRVDYCNLPFILFYFEELRIIFGG